MSTPQVILKKPKLSSDLKSLINSTVIAENEENNVTLTSYYEKCINQAIVDGWPRHEISAKLLKELDLKLFQLKQQTNSTIHEEECKINRRWYYQVARKLDCTDPKYQRNLKTDEEPHLKNSSIGEENINFHSHLVLSEIINLCQAIKKKIETENKILFELFDKKTRLNFYKETETIVMNLAESFDDKVKIPKSTEYLFVSIIGESTTSLNKSAIKFMQERLNMANEQNKKIITLKQTNKFLKNLKTSKLELFHPHDIQQSLFDGFVGVQCVCQSWKVRFYEQNKHKLECQDCEKVFPAINLPRCPDCLLLFYRENILKIIENNGRCPNEDCNAPITLYEDLKIWALHG